jgi:hypothetical protein
MGFKSLAVSALAWNLADLQVVAARVVENHVGAPLRLLGLLIAHDAEILQPLVPLPHVLNPEHYRGQPLLVDAALERLHGVVFVRLKKQPGAARLLGRGDHLRLALGTYIRSM